MQQESTTGTSGAQLGADFNMSELVREHVVISGEQSGSPMVVTNLLLPASSQTPPRTQGPETSSPEVSHSSTRRDDQDESVYKAIESSYEEEMLTVPRREKEMQAAASDIFVRTDGWQEEKIDSQQKEIQELREELDANKEILQDIRRLLRKMEAQAAITSRSAEGLRKAEQGKTFVGRDKVDERAMDPARLTLNEWNNDWVGRQYSPQNSPALATSSASVAQQPPRPRLRNPPTTPPKYSSGPLFTPEQGSLVHCTSTSRQAELVNNALTSTSANRLWSRHQANDSNRPSPIADRADEMEVDSLLLAKNTVEGNVLREAQIPSTRPNVSIPKPLHSFDRLGRKGRGNVTSPQSSRAPPDIPVRPEEHITADQRNSNLNTTVLAEQLANLVDSLKTVFLNHPETLVRQSSRASSRLFRQQTIRRPKREGRTERLKWVRDEVQSILEINKDMEILNKAPQIYASNSPLQSSMDAYELGEGTGPLVIKPMQINWTKIEGKWNERLFDLFVQHCEREQISVVGLSDADLLEIRELFFNRLRRLATIVNKYRPSQTETLEGFAKRVKDRHTAELSRQRRTTRRNELRAIRTETALANMPDVEVPIEELTEEQRMWLDIYRILREYGEAGVSSDETDGEGSGIYTVRKLDWINNKYAKRVASQLDKARCTTNQYGNPHGNQPRKRERHTRNTRLSERKPPMQLPLNLYREEWYSVLPASHKALLRPKAPMVMYATWETDSEDD